jgi:hypothetical protein
MTDLETTPPRATIVAGRIRLAPLLSLTRTDEAVVQTAANWESTSEEALWFTYHHDRARSAERD